MRRTVSSVLGVLLLGLLLASELTAGTWPKLEMALESWTGAKEIQLVSSTKDPLGSAGLLPLIEMFLGHGFAVGSTAEAAASGAGLLVEVRRIEGQELIVLKRAGDQAIIAMERTSVPAEREAVTASSPREASPPPTQRTSPVRYEQSSPIPIEGSPVALVWLVPSSQNGGNLALMADAGITLYRLQDRQLQKLVVVAPPKEGWRPVALSSGDLDGDGSAELAAVWAEDVYDIYAGTNSEIWSELFSVEQQKLVSHGVQAGYIRLFASQGVIQQRGDFSPFAGPVRQLRYQKGKVAAGSELDWGGRGIFSLTPFDDSSGVAWLSPGKPAVVSLKSGEPFLGGAILDNLGERHTVEIAVRLAEPEYRSGFGVDDKVLEKYVSMPQRLVRSGENSMLTLYAERKPGTFLLGRPEGEDRLVRLTRTADGLTLAFPFPPVKSFIVDFTKTADKNGSEVLLLLNDKEDAGGHAYLLFLRELQP